MDANPGGPQYGALPPYQPSRLDGPPMTGSEAAAKRQSKAAVATTRGWSAWSADLVTNRDFLIIWLVPTAVFFGTMVLWAFLYFWAPMVCIFFTAIGVVVFAAFLIPAVRRSRGEILLPLGLTCLPAILLGSFIGLYIYDSFTIFPYFYSNTRLYTNVSPAEAAAAVADGGKLIFSSETFVDTDSAVSYVAENGNKYCVAPIHDNANIDRIQFWAAGINCCESSHGQNASFSCDAAGDSNANAGIVVFDNNGYFEESRYKYYQRARDKAEATFGLNSVARPTYVRWVNEGNLSKLSHDYTWRAIGHLVLFLVLYLLLSLVLAYNLYQFRKLV